MAEQSQSLAIIAAPVAPTSVDEDDELRMGLDEACEDNLEDEEEVHETPCACCNEHRGATFEISPADENENDAAAMSVTVVLEFSYGIDLLCFVVWVTIFPFYKLPDSCFYSILYIVGTAAFQSVCILRSSFNAVVV